jgi:serine/threonine-protein kinase
MAPNPQDDALLQPGSRLGSYSIVRRIGEGGMGTVYEGVHEGLGKRVAIKTLHAAGARSEELIGRFIREGKAAARIQHPNVVDVVDVGAVEGMPYLIMEYLEGQDLGAALEHDAPMTSGAIADLMMPVVSALTAVHEAGIVHRDLKPDNIFITRSKGGALEPKLVDFGISKLDDAQSLQLTGTSAILGTPYYMSPEQAASSKQIDYRSDIFSLGVILYQCATHELPFNAESLFQLLTQIVRVDPPALRSLQPSVPAAFEALVDRAMRKEPAQRFQSAAELGAALLPFASERVRLRYEPEFGHIALTPGPATAAVITGQSAEFVDSESVPLTKSLRLPLLAGGALLIGLFVVALIAMRASEHAAVPASAAGDAIQVPTEPSALPLRNAIAEPAPPAGAAAALAVGNHVDSAGPAPAIAAPAAPTIAAHDASAVPRVSGAKRPGITARPIPSSSGSTPSSAKGAPAAHAAELPAPARVASPPPPTPAAPSAPSDDELFQDRK